MTGMSGAPWPSAAGPEPVDLKSSVRFALLSGAAITSTGGGTINGDVGASPIAGSAIVLGPALVNGTIYVVGDGGPAGSVADPARLTEAKADLAAAFTDAAGRMPVPEGAFLNPGDGNLGGLCLGPGVYKFTTSALVSGGDVTLAGDSNDVWIFEVGSTLTLAGGTRVVLTNGAQARHVFWQVGTSASIGTSALIRGSIMAAQSITFDAGSVLEGRALAMEAAITFNGTSATLPQPEAPRFTRIFRATPESLTVVLETTPYQLVTLGSSPVLAFPVWTWIATNDTAASNWAFTDFTATSAVTQRFYKAFSPTF